MKKKPMIVGLVLLILCIGGYFGVKAYNSNEEKKEEAKTMTPVEVIASEVTGFSYINEGTTLKFEKDGENWLYSDDTTININEETIDGMIETVCGITSTQQVTAENLSDYGFDTPENTITLTTAAGTTEITIGMYNEILSQYYMSINGSTEMYLIGSDIISSLGNSVEELTVVETTEDTPTETTDVEETGIEE